MLPKFLEDRGFTDLTEERVSFGSTSSQRISGKDEEGSRVKLWVRLCWRREGRAKSARRFSAAQLRARITGDDWVGTIRTRIEREVQRGTTHLLLVQRDGKRIIFAAQIPVNQVLPIWLAQRDVSREMLQAGRLGRRKKNHAMNGSSPTLWLQDDACPEVAEALWGGVGVRDLVSLSATSNADDSLDDLPGLDYGAIGSDGAPRVKRQVSGVNRDPRVRRAVLDRAKGKCERSGCGVGRPYPAFLDVHHILGAGKGDRVWNCVALCPNCHREAHVAPDQVSINAQLLTYARQYKVARATPKQMAVLEL
jgi:5-methylcytosine-specific restriction protein A